MLTIVGILLLTASENKEILAEILVMTENSSLPFSGHHFRQDFQTEAKYNIHIVHWVTYSNINANKL